MNLKGLLKDKQKFGWFSIAISLLCVFVYLLFGGCNPVFKGSESLLAVISIPLMVLFILSVLFAIAMSSFMIFTEEYFAGLSILVLAIIVILYGNSVSGRCESGGVCTFMTFNMFAFSIEPHATEPASKSVIYFHLINNRGTNITINSIAFLGNNGENRNLGQGDNSELYIWLCPVNSESCSLNASSFPFNMAPGQHIFINSTLNAPMGFTENSRIVINYTSSRSISSHIDTALFRCIKNSQLGD